MEQIKKLYLVPSNLGIEKINSLIMQLITFILNIYGKRLLKLNVDKLIKNYTCDNNCNLFHFYPLYFEQVSRTFLANLLNIKSGTINNLVITLPRNTFSNSSMIITIENIELTVSIVRNDSIYYSVSSQDGSDLGDEDKLDENGELVSIFREINSMLRCYFDKIRVEIKMIRVKILDHFIILFDGIKYDSHVVFIEKIRVETLDNDPKKLASVEKVKFDATNFALSIGMVDISEEIVCYLPVLYIDDSAGSVRIDVTIGSLTFGKVYITNFDFTIEPEKFVINGCEVLEIDNALIFKHSKKSDSRNGPKSEPFLLYYNQNNVFLINQIFDVKIVNLHNMMCWFGHFTLLARTIAGKLVTLDEKSVEILKYSDNSKINVKECLPDKHPFCENSIHFDNIHCNIVYNENIYLTEIRRVHLGKIIKLVDLGIKYNNIIATCDKLLVDENGSIHIIGVCLKTPGTSEVPNSSHSFYIRSNHVQIKKTDHEYKITLEFSKVFNVKLSSQSDDNFPEKKDSWQSYLSFQEFICCT
ncbi:MAG: hypothetical protein QW303_05850, partial [Nitrososphaerota archaeon]